jgi:uncharacterized membrane protein
MKIFSKENIHKFFEAGLIIKSIDCVGEVTLGVLFLVLSPDTVNRIIFFMTRDELTEKPRDFIWNILLHNFNGLTPGSQSFWAVVFLANGLAKVLLVIGLATKRLWIYPVAAVVFGIFVLYQTYHLIFIGPSVLLGTFTLIDAAFTVLIICEYRNIRATAS